MIIRIGVEEALQRLGRLDIEVTQGTLSDAVEGAADLFIVCSDLKDFIVGLHYVIILDDVMADTEILDKLKEYI